MLSLYCAHVYAQENGCLCADIVILSDFSGSMNGSEGVVKESVETLIQSIPPEDYKIRFALVSFSDHVYTEVPLTSNHKELVKGVEEYESKSAVGVNTWVTLGLKRAYDVFVQNEQRRGCFRIVVIISDGYFDDAEEAIGMAKNMRSHHDYPIAVFSLSTSEDSVLGSPRALMLGPSQDAIDNCHEKNLRDVSGGAFFGRDTEALRDEIRKYDICL